MCGGGGNVLSNIGNSVKNAVKNPLKTVEGIGLGSAIGGPLGAIGGGLAGSGGGSPIQDILGGLTGGAVSPATGISGSLNPYSNISAPNIYGPNWQQDQQALTGATGNVNQTQGNLLGQMQGLFGQEQQGLTGIGNQQLQDTQNLQGNQMGQIQNLINTQLGQETQNLTTGPQGVALRNYYNNLGLDPGSGAFQSALANQFGQVAQQGQDQLLQQGVNNQNTLQGIVGNNAQNQASLLGQQQQGLGGVDTQTASLLNQLTSGGLNRQFGLQDTQTNADLQTLLANLTGKTGTNNALLGAGGDVLSGVMGMLGGGGSPVGVGVSSINPQTNQLLTNNLGNGNKLSLF